MHVIDSGALIARQLRLHATIARLLLHHRPCGEIEVTLREAAVILCGGRIHRDTRLDSAVIVLERRLEAVDLGRHDVGMELLARGGRKRRGCRGGRLYIGCGRILSAVDARGLYHGDLALDHDVGGDGEHGDGSERGGEAPGDADRETAAQSGSEAQPFAPQAASRCANPGPMEYASATMKSPLWHRTGSLWAGDAGTVE